MRPMFSNATVMWSEAEIEERECLIRSCYNLVRDVWTDINPAIRFCRVETPILTPRESLAGHVAEGFPMLDTKRGLMRPETTAGCVSALHMLYPQEAQLKKRLPFCVWQAGKSFREEENPETMRASKLRLVEFWQLEFELFTSSDTKAEFIECAVDALVCRFGGRKLVPDALPHYSSRTVDWMMDDLEVAGCSVRKDWPLGMIHEVSIGLDRLLVKTLRA